MEPQLRVLELKTRNLRNLKFTAAFWASLLILERSMKSPEFWGWSNALGVFFPHRVRKGRRNQQKSNTRLKSVRCDKIKKWGLKHWMVLEHMCQLWWAPGVPRYSNHCYSIWICFGGLWLARCCQNTGIFTDANPRATLLVHSSTRQSARRTSVSALESEIWTLLLL